MIIWSGWGFLVVFFFLFGFLLGIPVGAMFPSDPGASMAATLITAGLVAGLCSFLFARKIEGGEGRAFVDEASGERILVKRSAGSLFFVPTRYWAYVAPVLAIGLAVLLMASPQPDGTAVAAEVPPPVAVEAPAT